MPFPGEFEFVVDEGMHQRTGRVTAFHDGSPVAGAKIGIVTNRFESTDWLATRTQTDEQGNFGFLTPKGKVSVSVTAPDYMDTWSHDFGPDQEISIRLDRRGIVTGIVVSCPCTTMPTESPTRMTSIPASSTRAACPAS